ncbi:MAG: hypothetical protein KKE69_06510 [Alphaproteobacteria bacterium]|nr:hypothetical protein [Alphaproteobacteria bacterium]MBU1605415.1 hypothetical protein [Alphaproteobacteria bacterium]
MHLATGAPHVRQDGERIVATIPSGNSEIEIALNYGQATRLAETMIRLVRQAIYEDNQTASAEIVPFKRKQRKG